MTASEEIDAKLAGLGDWRGALLGRLRDLIRATDPRIEEDLKWRKASNPTGVPTWSLGGILCTGELYRDKVKLTFARGAALADPKRLFNASLTAGTRRTIDFPEGATVDEKALKALIREAIAANG